MMYGCGGRSYLMGAQYSSNFICSTADYLRNHFAVFLIKYVPPTLYLVGTRMPKSFVFCLVFV